MIFTMQNIPVLMYHALIDEKDDNINFVHVLKREFAKQMEWLSNNGYRTITLNEFADCLVNRRKISGKPVVLTFDDGYHSLYTYATPILQQYGFKATLFLTTASVGETSYKCLPHCKGYPLEDRPLTWEELREMKRRGWEIQPHGHRHYVHSLLTGNALEDEIYLSKQAIWSNLGLQAEFYCYPHGNFNSETLEKIKSFGFKAAFSVQQGFANTRNDIRAINRIGVTNLDDIRFFRRKVRTGYPTIREMFNWKLKNLVSRCRVLRNITTWCKGKLGSVLGTIYLPQLGIYFIDEQSLIFVL